MRDSQINLGPITLHLATKRIPVSHRGPVLAAFATIDQIKALAKSDKVTNLLYIPWQENEVPAFRKLFPGSEPIPQLPLKDQ